MESPLINFVNELYTRRVEAKEKGDKAMAFIHKTTMNIVYGRFGISPECTMRVIVSHEEAKKLAQDGFIDSEQLDEDKFVVI